MHTIQRIKNDIDEYFVYAFDNPLYDVMNSLKILSVCFCFCIFSCGFHHCMKLPCRHILYITRSCTQPILSLRWLCIYQFAFERVGYENLTNLFRKIEENKRSLEKESSIFHSNIVNDNSVIPQLFKQTTQDAYEEIKLLHFAAIKAISVMRGFNI